jgi:hypothetical protein
MVQAEAALRSNANDALQQARQSIWTLKQEEMAREFMEAYGLARKQISFDGVSEQPIFDFDALSILSLKLTDIPDIRVEPGDFHNAAGIATAICRITLRDGRTREVYGNCLVGEVMHDDSEGSDIGQALKIAQARALRTGLRAVGFDPVRAHRMQQSEAGEFQDLRTSQLAELHILGAELGYIIGDDKTAWKNLVHSHFGVTSSADLNELQRSQFLTTLRALKAAHDRSQNSELTQNLLVKE